MAGRLADEVWNNILRRIDRQNCTPFLGAGACAGRLPVAAQVAQDWASQHGYPLLDSKDLARVAQFLAVQVDDMRPKEEIAELCAAAQPPDFRAPDEIHGVLADLPCKVYITTNYDDFMLAALETRNRPARHELCRWNRYVEDNFRSVFDREPGYEPDKNNPLVYHFHGCKQMPESMVVTEDDYLDFLVRMSRDASPLPAPIKAALAGSSLLFIGYSLADWSFRVLFRALISSLDASLSRQGIAVQLSPLPDDKPASDHEKAQAYLDKYFSKIQKIPVSIYWGDVHDFAAELRARWEAYCHDRRR